MGPAVAEAPLPQEGDRVPAARRRGQRWLPLSEMDFVGCVSETMTGAQYEAFEGRLEFWDSETETAFLARDLPTMPHEHAAQCLARLVARIALVRGSDIRLGGAVGLVARQSLEGGRERKRAMQADQTVYLHPHRSRLPGAGHFVLGEHDPPDVTLEVDHTTDVRGGKLKQYAEWGFPELWVEVPVIRAPSRPRGRKPGLAICLLGEGGYSESAESRAFPGWKASEIHAALNESVMSLRTHRMLERVGRALGEHEGTGPDDDPLLRCFGRRKRAEGASGMLREVLRRRGIAVSPAFPTGLSRADRKALLESSETDLVAAAFAAGSEADFLRRLRRPR